MNLALNVRDLEKSFGARAAVQGVTFSIASGSLTAMLGPNGAGKSTTIKMLLGLRTPDSGAIEILGLSPKSKSLKQLVGYASQDLNFPAQLKAYEVLSWIRAHYSNAMGLTELRHEFGLSEIWSRRIGGLSGGEKRRLGLACAFAGRPKLVILDEPATGLDLDGRKALNATLRDFCKKGGTVLLCTHELNEVQKIADSALLIDHGKVLYSGTVSEILNKIDFKRVTYFSHGKRVETVTANSDQFIRTLVAEDQNFSELEIHPASLEEAFSKVRARL